MGEREVPEGGADTVTVERVSGALAAGRKLSVTEED